MTQERAESSSLRHYLGVLRRHKLLFLYTLLVIPLAIVFLSLQQEKLYRASAEVLLSRESLAVALTGASDTSSWEDPTRFVQTQADLSRVPVLARRVVQNAGLSDRTARQFLSQSAVTPRPDSNLLEFSVTDRDPRLATRLATEYARQFTSYRRQLDTALIFSARRELDQRLRELEAAGNRRTTLYETFAEKAQQLRTIERLNTSRASLVQPAERANQVQPRPLRNGILGVVLGVVFALGFVFLRELLDTRVRSAEAIGAGLQLPLLGRLPHPPRKLRKRNQLVTLAAPYGHQAEPFRILRTNFAFANLELGARTVMVTSAVEEEGKSTTIANLAVTIARAGARVALVDLDLRRPYLHRFFDQPKRPGLTDVALGETRLDDALKEIALPGAAKDGSPAASRNGDSAPTESLWCLPAGTMPPDPGGFVATHALSGILTTLSERFDLVLIDAPPLLHVGDAITLSEKVDGMLVVTRLNVIRRPMLKELQRILATCPTAKLGFILTAAEREEGYGYQGYYVYDGRDDDDEEAGDRFAHRERELERS